MIEIVFLESELFIVQSRCVCQSLGLGEECCISVIKTPMAQSLGLFCLPGLPDLSRWVHVRSPREDPESSPAHDQYRKTQSAN